MTKYVIHGGKPLHGEVEISGAKNAAVAILPAALLVDGVCRIENVHDISDVTMILGIMKDLGANVRTINPTTVELDCSKVYKQNGGQPGQMPGSGSQPGQPGEGQQPGGDPPAMPGSDNSSGNAI